MKRTAVLIALLSALALLAGCGNDAEHENMPAGDSGGAANDADIEFATQMIPHHEQAIEMAKLAPSRAQSAQVKDLAATVEKAQDPEIETMTGWLKEWGAPAPSHGMDHGGMAMPSMMTDADMGKLEKATGAAFDRMWMTMMIEHHEGAIAMAKTELQHGKHAGAKRMAQDIIDAQQAEIDEMHSLLKQG